MIAFIESIPVIEPNRLSHESGLYFICSPGQVLYVGKSVDLKARWGGHELKGLLDKPENHLRVKLFDSENFCNLEHEESAFIVFLRPKYNQRVKCKVWPEWWKTSTTRPTASTLMEGDK